MMSHDIHDELTVNAVVLHLKSGGGVNLDIDFVFLNLGWDSTYVHGGVWCSVVCGVV